MTPGAPPVLPSHSLPPRRATATPPVLKSDPHRDGGQRVPAPWMPVEAQPNCAQLSRDMAGYQQVPLEIVEDGLAAANAELYEPLDRCDWPGGRPEANSEIKGG